MLEDNMRMFRAGRGWDPGADTKDKGEMGMASVLLVFGMQVDVCAGL